MRILRFSTLSKQFLGKPFQRYYSMFSNLGTSIAKTISQMGVEKKLNKKDVTKMMTDIETALLEADVAQPIVKTLISQVVEDATGAEIKGDKLSTLKDIILTRLTTVLGENVSDLAIPPKGSGGSSILVTGIQGSGKTTTSGKLAQWLTNMDYKVLLVSLDTQRPAAQEQLEILAKSAEILSLPIMPFETPLQIAHRSRDFATLNGVEVIIYDSAGRLHVDDSLMSELAEISNLVNPIEKLLVADSSLGMDAVQISKEFKDKIGITGIILSRMDGDAKGGAAISMRAMTQIPIKFVGIGERLGDFEKFIPSNMASRIIGSGDFQQLVEKAKQISGGAGGAEKAKETLVKAQQGKFDFDDYLTQLNMMKKAGSLSSIASMIPGLKLDTNGKDLSFVEAHEAIIKKMTPEERSNPAKLKQSASHRIKIAKTASVTVLDINRMMQAFEKVKTAVEAMMKLGPQFQSMTPEQLLKSGSLKDVLSFKQQVKKVSGQKLPPMFKK